MLSSTPWNIQNAFDLKSNKSWWDCEMIFPFTIFHITRMIKLNTFPGWPNMSSCFTQVSVHVILSSHPQKSAVQAINREDEIYWCKIFGCLSYPHLESSLFSKIWYFRYGCHMIALPQNKVRGKGKT